MQSIMRVLIFAVSLFLATGPAHAQFQLIRDAEIEATVRDLASPIFSAAGVSPSSVDIYLIADDRLNAFVAGGQNMFLNTGLLMRAETPEQLAGVIAHETGHIAGGHLVRLSEARDNASVEQILGLVLGAAAAVAGSPELGGAITMGGQGLAMQNFLAFTRSQEQSADQAAVGYLDRTGIGSRGLLEFFEVLDQQRLLTGARESPYLQTHPLTRDRMSFVERHVASSPPAVPMSADAQERHARMVAKLRGYIEQPSRALASFGDSQDVASRYGRVIATYRLNDVAGALREIDALLALEPNNPYFHELKGQMLYETGRVNEAVEPYRQAVRLGGGAAPLQLGLGRALLESGDPDGAAEALRAVVRAEPRNSFAWRTYGIALGRAGDLATSNLALAEGALLQRKVDDAGLYLTRAEDLVTSGTQRQWLNDLQQAFEIARDDARRR